MAVTRLASITTFAAAAGGTQVQSKTHTVDSGTAWTLLCAVSTPTIQGVAATPELGGVQLSLLTTVLFPSTIRANIYGLVSPVAGSSTMSIRYGGAQRGGWIAFNLGGVDTTTPSPFQSGKTATSSAVSATVQSGTTQYVFDLECNQNGDTVTATAGASQSFVTSFIGSATGGVNSALIGISERVGAATQSNLSWALSGSASWSQVVVTVNAPAVGSSGIATSTSIRNAMYRRRRRS